MAHLTIILDGDNAAPELRGKTIHVLHEVKVTALDGGMQSGAPSVAFLAQLPNGEGVMIETSLKLFLSAADAFRARYGDPR